MADSHVLGMNALLYYGTSGSTATNEVTNARDVTLNLTAAEADITTRANSGWRATVATLREATLDFEMLWLEDDEAFAAILAAYLASDLIALKAISQDGGEGIDGDFSITSFSRSEPLEDAQKVTVSAKLAVYRTWSVGAGS